MGAAIEGAIGQFLLEMSKVSIYLSCVSYNVHLLKMDSAISSQAFLSMKL